MKQINISEYINSLFIALVISNKPTSVKQISNKSLLISPVKKHLTNLKNTI